MNQISDSDRMTLKDYAKRRGVTRPAVSQAISAGRLVASVERDAKGRPWIVDPELADREWTRNTDLSKAPGSVQAKSTVRESGPSPVDDAATEPHEGMTLPEANAIKAVWQAKKAKLEYQEAAKELVPSADVRGKLEDVFRSCRTKLLGIPARARQQDPGLTVAQLALFEALIREALEDLAAGGGT